MVGVGAALMIVGTVAVAVGALTSSSSVKLSSPGAARPAARVLPRAPTWARAELPSPPHHTPLLQLQF